ncbi:ATP-binding protein [Thalassobacillus hwangdonensis]|uniref:ATP-binding protein n=2 Tax=Thalassobacillus hwangdonensis TaxID=546108 RepID=A0ABW3L181_9BACI
MGIDVRQDGDRYVINSVSQQSWADREGIQPGAEIKWIEDRPPGEHYTVEYFNAVEKVDNLTLQLNGTVNGYKDIEITGMHDWVLSTILPAGFFVLILGIAYILFQFVAKRPSINMLILFFMTIALAYMSNSGAARLDLYALFLNRALFLLVPVIMIHFLHQYFKELDVEWYSRKVYIVLYGFVIAVSLTELYNMQTNDAPSILAVVPHYSFLILLALMFLVICLGYRKYKDSSYGPIFKYINLGLGVAFFPYIFFYLAPTLVVGDYIIPLNVAALSIIALPITFLYLVTRQRLIDITFVMTRLRYYALISFLPSIFILLLVMYLGDETFSLIKMSQLYLSVHGLLILFLSLKETLDFRLQRRLFAAKYSYQESMHRLSQEMKEKKNVVDLLKRIRYEIKNVLNVKDVRMYSKHFNSGMYCVHSEMPFHVLKKLDDAISNTDGEIGTIIESEEGFGVIIGYSLNKITLMWCAGKKDFTNLNRDEKTYLQTIAHNTNIALENLNTIEDLFNQLKDLKSDQTQRYPAWLSRLLFTIAENQRKQLSIDLHDTVLQEQLFLYRRLDDMLENRQDMAASTRSELDMFKESLLDSIHLIRETCNELRPAFIEEVGLVQSLQNLIQQYQLRSNFTVYFDDSSFSEDLDQERVLAVYRIVQELLSNAMKHSYAKIVKLRLYNDENGINLIYSDNGIGMEYEEKKDLFSHIGLSGIEQRVNGLNGNYQVNSSPGKGFTMKVELPLTYRKGVVS